ncbi:hypothetical protein EVAR_85750_1 [Eumeta japonica]|uniref:Uncharacterized protein n=1 Tax=Eumeta variegata TaxID=151549 RepID=A0A4C1ZJ25_EUMVA|nr:hypothetical protein EVAR_85750_1 [Eumeta japonica]
MRAEWGLHWRDEREMEYRLYKYLYETLVTTKFNYYRGNIQRSKIVCEGIQEAREDILRVFTHQTVVADILTRQADKRCFRKHRTQS